jgi:cyclic pyranopterin phosphate synthase
MAGGLSYFPKSVALFFFAPFAAAFMEDAPVMDDDDSARADADAAPSLPSGGGEVGLADVTGSSAPARTAVAAGRVEIGEAAFRQIEETLEKDDVLTVAQIAGITGAKLTSRLIPLCHSVQINGIDLELSLADDDDEGDHAVVVRAYLKSTGPTGVEMEAMTAVSVAALTVYDMCKSITKDIEITDVRLLAKTGGSSGDYRRGE